MDNPTPQAQLPQQQELQAHQLVRRTIALVLAGGRGSRLKQLTDRRAKPAVYFGGKFRIIDFALSNCLNSGIRRMAVVTQYKSHSLMRHLQRGWSFLRAELNEMVDVLPAQQRVGDEHWYRGTADAVFQNLDIIQTRSTRHDYVVVLAGDHIYKMDYSLMVKDHAERGLGCTVGCIEVPRMEATAFGVMAVDDGRQITDFLEKPADPPAMPGRPDTALASMGIYVFDSEYLYQLLEEDNANPDSSHDFGKDIIPRAVAQGRALAHPFGMSCVTRASRGPEAKTYWRDVGTIDAFWAANLDLASITPELDIYDTDWPIWTYQRQLPPAKFVLDRNGHHGMTVNTIVSGGCIVSGSKVSSSVLFSGVRVHSFCEINEAVLLPDVEVGRGARLNRVVIDRACVIPEDMVIGEDAEADAARFERTENGVVLVTREMLKRLASA
ncbi:glucose-1-phosphate adenylyltransferase [Variovorax sp. NFACC27]|uniref:Glucose-1-phosphate adenylyltransferase n=1 Tax=Variovorax gossypii TaxID=1679495 RepID=A0A431TDR6_9BURK|nr:MULTISPECIES: glucose-1-phosphate adenylyltransferase [Variovorax]MDP9607359.1 glucose-1-phosphate adenylyltransferase [Variovorax paradoxus]SEF25938.1 glucose-1-phosphate adenylyltransferase [Variovorax sp. NFACC28]SEG50651.1 glucose-1-phosphate adenylyltransferase [Variovorax sp. NFACC29]SFC20540.1 glucose-1-phosphate adenylyltransferase [Variovorax sp. NFACC26]SFH08549.1 glucose-1-phosphate adenylyltransferase [Variovorax sp. NFACC27]